MQPDEQLHGVGTLQARIGGEDGPKGSERAAMAMCDCMLDMPILREQHPKIREGLAAIQWLPCNVPGALLMAPSKDNHLCLGNADGEAMG